MPENEHPDEEYSFYNLFVPLTNKKAIFIIIIVGIIVFFNMLFNGFVLDDLFQIVNNENIKSNIFYYFTHEIGPYYRPLMLTTFSIFYKIFGIQPFFFHFWQLTIHILNTILLFIFLSEFFKKKYVALFLSLIFLVHPINTETVNYVSLLQDTYFIFFGLLSLVLIIKKGLHTKILICSSLLLLLSVFSKETGVLFIFIQFAYVYLYHRKFFLRDLLFSFLVLTIYAGAKFVLFGNIISPNNFLFTINNTVITAPFLQRIINIPSIILFYFRTFLFPVNLAIDQFWWEKTITFSQFYLPLIIDLFLLLLFSVLGYTISKQNKKEFRLYIFFAFWLVIGLSFHSQILRLDSTVAEHFFYFPMIGLLGLIGVGIQQTDFNKNIQSFFMTLGIIILIVFSLRTIARNANWYSPLTLYSHDISISNNADLQYNLGLAYGEVGNYLEAIKYIKESIVSIPSGYLLWQNLGDEYFQSHDYRDAATAFIQAIKLKPDFYGAYIDLVNTLLIDNNPKEAKGIIENEIVKKWPNNSSSWRLLGFANYMLKDKADTLKDFKKAYKLDPSDENAYYYFNIQQNKPVILKI